MSGRILFKAENIDVFYGSSQILFGVSIELAEGQTMALLGRNGAGKSTTLKAIAGLAPPRRGRIAVTGLDTHDRKPHLIARAGVGFVPEDRQVFPEHPDRAAVGRAERRIGADRRPAHRRGLAPPARRRRFGNLVKRKAA